MAQTKSDNVQINISIPTGWKTELENLARIYSVEEGKTITFLDLMRRGIQEKFEPWKSCFRPFEKVLKCCIKVSE